MYTDPTGFCVAKNYYPCILFPGCPTDVEVQATFTRNRLIKDWLPLLEDMTRTMDKIRAAETAFEMENATAEFVAKYDEV
jgi:hypothetical protein